MKKQTANKRKTEWFPTIDYKKCIGCMACVEFCSHGVYTSKNGKPQVIAPEKCVVGCNKCDNICPNGAITHPSKLNQTKSSCGCNCGGKCK
jgi:NAD-dependent dihydropyrimidine dehydrogenase PreA subunit